MPLVVQTEAANRHDGSVLLPLVLDIPAIGGKPGRPKRKPAAVVADKAFDDGRCALYSAGSASRRSFRAAATIAVA